jgi:uncharacterized membrane protein YqjE
MAPGDRSIPDVLQDIIRNVQEIVRSEVRLAKTEIREELDKARSSTLLLGAGAATAMFAVLFLLLTVVYALALVMPEWAAAMLVGAALAAVAIVLFAVGLKRFKQIHPTPARTVETIKENVEWARQHTK